MKLTFRTLLLLLGILLGSCTSDQQQFVLEPKNSIDTELTYLVDGIQTSKAEVMRQNDSGLIDLIELAPDPRSALLKYGEKFRHGVYIFKKNDKEKK